MHQIKRRASKVGADTYKDMPVHSSGRHRITRDMGMERKRLWLTFSSLFLVLSAPTVDASRSTRFGLDSGSELRLMTGILNGRSGEYVYDANGLGSGIPGYKVSELQWQLDNVLMAGAAFTHRGDRLHLNAEVWTNAGDGDGTMDDYDWLYVGYDWSHWSHHDNTTVREATRMGVNAEFTIRGSRTDRFFGMLGYEQSHFDWQARGGTGIYSIDGYRDSLLVFTNVPGISYEQTFRTPYLGVGYEAASRSEEIDIFLDASIRYSRWAEGEDIDVHHLRDLKFEEGGSGGTWLSYGVTLDFRTRSSVSFLIGYAYQKYQEIKGATTVTDFADGTVTHYPGEAAGLDHQSKLYSIGMTYRF